MGGKAAMEYANMGIGMIGLAQRRPFNQSPLYNSIYDVIIIIIIVIYLFPS